MTRRLLPLMGALTIPCASLAQGTINFSNDPWSLGYEAPVFGPDGVLLSGDAWWVQLYAGPYAQSLAPIGASIHFQTGDYGGYFVGGTRTVATVAPGAEAALVVRVWEAGCGNTYEAALAAGCPAGSSPEFSVATGGDGMPPSLPANMVGFQPYFFGPPPPPAAPRLENPKHTGGSFSARIDTETGVVYTLLSKDSPDDTFWESCCQVPGNGKRMELIDTNPAPRHRIYRVAAERPGWDPQSSLATYPDPANR